MRTTTAFQGDLQLVFNAQNKPGQTAQNQNEGSGRGELVGVGQSWCCCRMRASFTGEGARRHTTPEVSHKRAVEPSCSQCCVLTCASGAEEV